MTAARRERALALVLDGSVEPGGVVEGDLHFDVERGAGATEEAEQKAQPQRA